VIEPVDLGLSSAVRSREMPHISLGSLEELEREHIQKVLQASGNNLSRAADILGITRSTLYSKIRKYNLEVLN
jgi:DNA-binding NtrC family response regulator